MKNHVTIVDTQNSKLLEELKKHYTNTIVHEYLSIKEYNKYLENCKVRNYKDFFFDEYINKYEIVLIISNGSKKIKKQILKNRCIPLQIVIIQEDKNIAEQLKSKISIKNKFILEKAFMKQYQRLLQQNNIELKNFIDTTAHCPFCRCGKFVFTHNYSHKNTSWCSIFLQCTSCDKVIDTQSILGLFDADYEYNSKIKDYLDQYTREYPLDKTILKQIDEECDKTKKIANVFGENMHDICVSKQIVAITKL